MSKPTANEKKLTATLRWHYDVLRWALNRAQNTERAVIQTLKGASTEKVLRLLEPPALGIETEDKS